MSKLVSIVETRSSMIGKTGKMPATMGGTRVLVPVVIVDVRQVFNRIDYAVRLLTAEMVPGGDLTMFPMTWMQAYSFIPNAESYRQHQEVLG